MFTSRGCSLASDIIKRPLRRADSPLADNPIYLQFAQISMAVDIAITQVCYRAISGKGCCINSRVGWRAREVQTIPLCWGSLSLPWRHGSERCRPAWANGNQAPKRTPAFSCARTPSLARTPTSKNKMEQSGLYGRHSRRDCFGRDLGCVLGRTMVDRTLHSLFFFINGRHYLIYVMQFVVILEPFAWVEVAASNQDPRTRRP